MKEVLILIIKLIVRSAFAYGLFYFFNLEPNPLLWSDGAKIFFVAVLVSILSVC